MSSLPTQSLLAAIISLMLALGGAVIQDAAPQLPATPAPIDWDILRRPLDLPTLEAGAVCPRTEATRRAEPQLGLQIGDGPLYPAFLAPDGVVNYGGAREQGGWFYVKVLWLSDDAYHGPVLVRGHQLDGPHELRFEGGAKPPIELRLEGAEGSLGAIAGWRGWPSYTRVSAPGCYAYQVDGENFSDVVVFQAIQERPSDLAPVPSAPLPHQLGVTSAVPIAPDRVRLALTGEKHLVLRLDVAPTQTAPLDLPGQDVHRLKSEAGTVVWQADATRGWPHIATWDDGRHRYRLEVLDADPGAWSKADLVSLVEAFAAAPEPTGS